MDKRTVTVKNLPLNFEDIFDAVNSNFYKLVVVCKSVTFIATSSCTTQTMPYCTEIYSLIYIITIAVWPGWKNPGRPVQRGAPWQPV